MARNSEKAMTTLARWRAANIENKKAKEVRPYLATECDNLQKAEKFRREIIGEISRLVAQVQNAGLGEFKLRELNDEINKKLREKGHWEDRIKELGGHDFRRFGPRMLDHEGREIPGNRGYKYFGATRDLPGVRELFERAPPPPTRKNRAELMKDIDADFYGYRIEDDGTILHDEHCKEIEIREKKKNDQLNHLSQQAICSMNETASEVNDGSIDKAENEEFTCMAYIAVPTQKEIEQALILRKKREILEKYVSEELLNSEEETKKVLGII